ncbi:amidohydrolase family protein [Thermodesulfobacteriota bacterium]
MKRIAIEEHFMTQGYIDYLRSKKDFPKLKTVEDEKHRQVERLFFAPDKGRDQDPIETNRLLDVGTDRLSEMDECGMDMQVLCLSLGVGIFEKSDGVVMAKKTNDELSEIIKKNPKRFSGFAVLAPQDPDSAADELTRAVQDLGLKGALLNSHVKGEYLDEKKYWVIFEAAEKLDVPIYLHPSMPSPAMREPFLTYKPLTGSMWGYGVDGGLHAMRLICSGVFDKYPGLKIILGHLGEALPFWLWRIDNRWVKEKYESDPFVKKLNKYPGQYIKENFFVTTSGMFWDQAFLCTYSALGADKILFAVDYPYEENSEAVDFMDNVPICDADKEKIYHSNAEKLLSLSV